MAAVSVRYIVDDVDAAIAFYCDRLGFSEVMHPAPAFAMLSRGDLRLLLSPPPAGPRPARPAARAGGRAGGGGRAGPPPRPPPPPRRGDPPPARVAPHRG